MLALDFDAPPSLSAAFADYRTHAVIAWADTVPADPAEDGPRPTQFGSSLDAERILRRHKLGKTGVIVMGIGAGATVVGFSVAILALVDSFDSGGGAAPGTAAVGLTGLAVGVLGTAAFTTGEVLMFTGGIGAAKLLGAPTTVGWVGVGLAIGAVGVNGLASTVDVPEIGYLSPLLSVGTLVCGAVQLGQSGHAGREAGVISLTIAPTPNGVRVGGTF